MKQIILRQENPTLTHKQEVRIMCDTCGCVDKAEVLHAHLPAETHNNTVHGGGYTIVDLRTNKTF